MKLHIPLKLEQYELKLSGYPELGNIRPFFGWDAAKSTKSLSWYDDYNAVKHDRETNFYRATVGSAIKAIAGVAVMLTAQYRVIRQWDDQIGRFFEFQSYPQWNTWEYFVPPDYWSGWAPLTFRF